MKKILWYDRRYILWTTYITSGDRKKSAIEKP